jgi:hypothetical protein
MKRDRPLPAERRPNIYNPEDAPPFGDPDQALYGGGGPLSSIGNERAEPSDGSDRIVDQ